MEIEARAPVVDPADTGIDAGGLVAIGEAEDAGGVDACALKVEVAGKLVALGDALLPAGLQAVVVRGTAEGGLEIVEVAREVRERDKGGAGRRLGG